MYQIKDILGTGDLDVYSHVDGDIITLKFPTDKYIVENNSHNSIMSNDISRSDDKILTEDDFYMLKSNIRIICLSVTNEN